MTDPAHVEQIVRDGPAGRAAVVFVLPLFEEANRLRRTVRLAMRALAARGIASLLPDLPGQNESLLPTEAATLARWREALARHVRDEDAAVITAATRGGALIDDIDAAAHWRLAPASGASLLKTMMRTRIASDREYGRDTTIADLDRMAADAPLRLAGNLLSPTMIAELRSSESAPLDRCRTVALGAGGEDRLAGRPLWLQAEPGEDAALAEEIAGDIAQWMAACAIS
ncbi:MAG: hypothetical protein GW859_07800 [Sphingomonadales bacterium]|nr:hypothetical protein [Sphingomonadales bacterium]